MEGENFSLVGRHLSAPASSSAPNHAVSSRIHLNQFSSASNHHLSNPTSISMISEGLISHPHLVLAPSQLTHLVSQGHQTISSNPIQVLNTEHSTYSQSSRGGGGGRENYIHLVLESEKGMNLVEYIKCDVVDEVEDCVLLPSDRTIVSGKDEEKGQGKDVYYNFQSNKRSVISENEHVTKTKLVFATKKRGKRKEKKLAGKIHTCTVCGAGFSSGKDLWKHGLTHTGEKPYSCHLCPQKFTSSSSKSFHIRSLHEQRQEHRCPDCGKLFSQNSNMNKHYKTIHLDMIVVACGICKRTFNQRSALSRHIKIVHKKEVPHQCDQCEKKFSQAESLKKHKMAIHYKSRDHLCAFCDYAASRPDMLRVHVRKIHTKEWRYECEICRSKGNSWGCILPKELRRHMQTRHQTKIDKPTPWLIETRSAPGTSNSKEEENVSIDRQVKILLNKLKHPLQFSHQLEAEVRAKACRAPTSVLNFDIQPSSDLVNINGIDNLISSASEVGSADLCTDDNQLSRQISLVYQDQPVSHIVSVDSEGRTRPVHDISSSAWRSGWLDGDQLIFSRSESRSEPLELQVVDRSELQDIMVLQPGRGRRI
ncbi:zinc finger protein Xfin [Eurytemora carolleeae]|uniref:zinc finger protein Xfin n=1 Tax=Eurytemora carolleeae TaxID=1294199 RepID=UPI000C7612E5|nr:zinc finger protein Xfin [Eurytemora carolleeae]|eukprot:XP_023335492.1 zinc finger protein Xfin-like [Eurytemora affinis]